MNRNGDYGIGSLIIFKREGDRAGVLLRLVESDFGGSPHWEVLMQDNGKIHRVLQINLANGRNTRYEII